MYKEITSCCSCNSSKSGRYCGFLFYRDGGRSENMGGARSKAGCISCPPPPVEIGLTDTKSGRACTPLPPTSAIPFLKFQTITLTVNKMIRWKTYLHESIKRPKEGRCFDYMLGRAATRGKTGKTAVLPGLCRIERGGTKWAVRANYVQNIQCRCMPPVLN